MHSYEEQTQIVEHNFNIAKDWPSLSEFWGIRPLCRWMRIYEEAVDLPVELTPKKRYSRAQKFAALEHYLTLGGCLAFTCITIEYPCNIVLKLWVEELYPGRRTLIIRSNECLSPAERTKAVRELCNPRRNALKIVPNIGVSVPVLHERKKNLTEDETYQFMRKRKTVLHTTPESTASKVA